MGFNFTNNTAIEVPYRPSLAPTDTISFGAWVYMNDWINYTDDARIISKTQEGGYHYTDSPRVFEAWKKSDNVRNLSNHPEVIKTLKLFDKKKYPIKIPKFDKLNDDRLTSSQIIKSKKNMIFLEGWCCGCPPLPNSFLQTNLNKIEKADSKYIWRKYYNKKLKKEYKLIFNHFEYLIYFKIPSFDCVLKWRIKQEKRLKLTKKKNINYMNKTEIKDFISYYEKITKWMMKNTISKSDLTIKINKNQKIQSIIT